MTPALHPQLAAHLRRHARKLHGLACGFGRRADADDVVQTLYARWWRRMRIEPGWLPPESAAELFVSVRRVVLDVIAKEKREQARQPHVDDPMHGGFEESPEDSLQSFERMQWILTRLPAPLAEALMASLTAGRRNDAAVALELGMTTATFTTRLFKARRAAEELASYYELLPIEQANLMAELSYGSKTRAQLAHESGMLIEELTSLWRQAVEALEKSRREVAS